MNTFPGNGWASERHNCESLVKPGTAYVLVARFAVFGVFFWGGGCVLGFLAAHSLLLFEIIKKFFFLRRQNTFLKLSAVHYFLLQIRRKSTYLNLDIV